MSIFESDSKILRKANYPRARNEAANVLAKFGIAKPPIDPERIAESMGINVVYVDFEPEMSTEISGFYDFKSKTIIVNKDIPPNRKTFTIAHELGHAILHQEYVASLQYEAMPRSNFHWEKPAEEVEADVFAACLLVPKSMLKSYRNYADVSELSEMFAVSPDVIVNQLKYI